MLGRRQFTRVLKDFLSGKGKQLPNQLKVGRRVVDVRQLFEEVNRRGGLAKVVL